jgi:ribonuclease P protein component
LNAETGTGEGRTGKFRARDRLLKRSEFLSVSRQGRKIQDIGFILFYQPGRSDRPRLGVTVSKRVGGAVTRNRLKRQMREYFRRNRSKLGVNLDFNLIAKPAAARFSGGEVQASLDRLFSQIKADS